VHRLCIVSLTASTSSPTRDLIHAGSILQSRGMATHVAFLHDEPLDEIMAGRKTFELRLTFRQLACHSVREGDVLLLKRVSGEVAAACNVGEVRLYAGLTPEEVSDLSRTYDLGAAKPCFPRGYSMRSVEQPGGELRGGSRPKAPFRTGESEAGQWTISAQPPRASGCRRR
jgi:hypothetical protein